jgi:hypothetical protein
MIGLLAHTAHTQYTHTIYFAILHYALYMRLNAGMIEHDSTVIRDAIIVTFTCFPQIVT